MPWVSPQTPSASAHPLCSSVAPLASGRYSGSAAIDTCTRLACAGFYPCTPDIVGSAPLRKGIAVHSPLGDD
jgi:hypothetical protein